MIRGTRLESGSLSGALSLKSEVFSAAQARERLQIYFLIDEMAPPFTEFILGVHVWSHNLWRQGGRDGDIRGDFIFEVVKCLVK